MRRPILSQQILLLGIGLSLFAGMAPLRAQGIVAPATSLNTQDESAKLAILLRRTAEDSEGFEGSVKRATGLRELPTTLLSSQQDDEKSPDNKSDAEEPRDKVSDKSKTANKKSEDSKKEDPKKEPTKEPNLDKRLLAIHKPLGEIGITRGVSEKAPVNQAADAHSHLAALQVTAVPLIANGPNRYSICACQQPLYFEEIRLERCGQACGIAQPAISAVTFVANTLILPYRWAATPPCQTECARGDCPTCRKMPCVEPVKPNVCGFSSQTAVTLGMLLLLF